MERINIAIDGPSAAGKSTIAKILAKNLGYAHIDTGAMYRCVALMVKNNGVNPDDEEKIADLMQEMNINFDEKGNVYLNDIDVSKDIRTNEMSMLASKVSAYPAVRKILTTLQQKMAENKGYILDGRDIGSVVLPDAELKIFMIASAQARANRRVLEYQNKGIEANYDEIYEDIMQRDYQDSHRANAPLKKCDDAHEIDTSDMSIDEVVEKITSFLK